jgi:hypothetical protein
MRAVVSGKAMIVPEGFGICKRLVRESRLLRQSDESWVRPKFVERGIGDRAHHRKRAVFITALEKI